MPAIHAWMKIYDIPELNYSDNNRLFTIFPNQTNFTRNGLTSADSAKTVFKSAYRIQFYFVFDKCLFDEIQWEHREIIKKLSR